jgi:hypothetical protein
LKFVLPALVLLTLALTAAFGEAGGEKPQPTPTQPATATQTPTAEPTATPTQHPDGAGGGGSGTVIPILTPFPSPEPVPADWATYTQPASEKSPAFTFSYPPTWFVEESGSEDPRMVGFAIALKSWDPSIIRDKPGWPPNSMKVDLGVNPAAGLSGCGDALNRAPGTTGSGRTEDFVPAPDAEPATLGGVSGWQVLITFHDRPDGLTRMHEINVVHDEICFVVAAEFAQENPDEETFAQIVSSFRFTDK